MKLIMRSLQLGLWFQISEQCTHITHEVDSHCICVWGHFWYTITSTFASTAGSKILLGITIHSMMLCHVNTLQFLHSNILYYILLKMVSAPIKVEKTRASLKTFDLQPQQYYRAHRVKRTLLPVKPYVNKAITVQTFYQDHSLAIAWHAHPHHAKKYPYYWKFLPLFIW